MHRLVCSLFLILCLVLIPLRASALTVLPLPEVQPVKYVFLFIGDGLSFPQRQLGEEFLRKTEARGLKINAMPYQAITTTRAAGDQFVTDSAAAGTAIACGVKTQNGVLGLDAGGNRVESIAEFALKNGRKVGIISSITLNHATPAAFYAHNASRGNDYEIGLDLVASGFHYFGGGGISRYNDRNAAKYRGSIYDLAQQAGYTVCRTPEQIFALKPGVEKVLAVGSLSSALPYAIDGNKEGLRLADFTKQAIELLDNPNGFFMMVEGGRIDGACHDNDAATTIQEIIEFDLAVSVAFDFAEKYPSEVLIVVTGDHETGGLILASAVHYDLLSKQKGSKGALMTQTEKFVNDNKKGATFENFKPIIAEQTGLVFTTGGRWQRGNLNLTREEMRELENDFNVSKKAILDNEGSKDRVVRTMIRILNSKSGVVWGTGDHTALPVNTSTWGDGGRIAGRIRDNTDIARLLKMAVDRYVPQERTIEFPPVSVITIP